MIKRCVANTMMGLQKELDVAAQELRAVDPTISLISGTELFLRFVSSRLPLLLLSAQPSSAADR